MLKKLTLFTFCIIVSSNVSALVETKCKFFGFTVKDGQSHEYRSDHVVKIYNKSNSKRTYNITYKNYFNNARANNKSFYITVAPFSKYEDYSKLIEHPVFKGKGKAIGTATISVDGAETSECTQQDYITVE